VDGYFRNLHDLGNREPEAKGRARAPSSPGALRNVMLFSVGLAYDISVIRTAELKPLGAH
jgi:hypothetical protein